MSGIEKLLKTIQCSTQVLPLWDSHRETDRQTDSLLAAGKY